VSCILAIDTAKASFDLSKLTEHVERLPPLDPDCVRRVLFELRRHCVEDFKFIPADRPGQEKDRLQLFGSAAPDLVKLVRRMSGRDLCDSIAEVVSTPRGLKQVVRRISRMWNSLAGEIDVDDVMLFAIVQECCPKAYAFLLAEMDALRGKTDDFNKRPETAKKMWQELIESDEQTRIARPVVEALGLCQIAGTGHSGEGRPQGVQEDEPTDYLRRLLAEEVSPGNVRDQEVLAEISAWVVERRSAMVDRLADCVDDSAQYRRIWEYFAWKIPDSIFPEVTRTLFAQVVKPVIETGLWEEHSALTACWRQQYHRDPRASVSIDDLCAMIDQVLPASIKCATDLYYFWTSPRATHVTRAERSQVRRHMSETARRILSSGEAVLRALRNPLSESPKGSLCFLVRPADEDGLASDLRDPADWSWLVAPLLAAMDKNPERVLPEIGWLLCDSDRQFDDETGELVYRLNRERAVAWCGSALAVLLDDVVANGAAAKHSSTISFVKQVKAWKNESTNVPAGVTDAS
jgi:hypothetical protein